MVKQGVVLVAALALVTATGLGACTVELTNGDVDGGTSETDASREDSGHDGGHGECAELGHDPHWSYEESETVGPEFWGELKLKDGAVAFPDCASTTKQQSPISIPAIETVDSGVLAPGTFKLGTELQWKDGATVKSLHHNGHTWLAGMDRSQKLVVDTTAYELAQFHFHAPAEHNIGNKEYPLEAHFVHVNPTANGQPFAAVVGVMFEESAEDNAELAKVWSKFDKCPHETAKDVSGVTVDLTKLLPANRSYVQYDGSLTTPPCSMTVRFHVLVEPIKASKKQIEALKEAVGKNDRPHQPILSSTNVSLCSQSK